MTNYEPNIKGKNSAVGGLLRSKVPVLGGVKIKNEASVVGLNFRLIDAETSEIVFTKQIESVIEEKGLAFGGIGFGGDVALGGFMDSYSRTPIGQAVIAGLNEGVYELVKQIGQQPAEGSIVKADETQIYINLGDGAVSNGERLQVHAIGEALIDPETGISLGSEDEYLGDIEIVETHEQFSIARPINLARVPDRGAKVSSTEAPATMEFAASWNPPK